LESLNGRVAGADFSVATKGSLNNERLEIGETQFNYSDWLVEFPYISVDRTLNTLDTVAQVSSTANDDKDVNADKKDKKNKKNKNTDKNGKNVQPDVYADIKISASFAGTESWSNISRAFKEFSGTSAINLSSVYFSESALPQEFSFDFSRLGNIIKISGGPQDMLDSQINTKGYFYASLASPSPVRGTIVGELKETTIDLNASNLFIDMPTLWKFIPSDFLIKCTDGFAIADIHIFGNRADPNIFGIIQSYNTKLNIPDFISAEIGPAPLTVHLNGNEVYFDPILTPVGEGEAYVTAKLQFERWVPRNYEISIDAKPEKPLPFVVGIAGIAANGLASGNINLTMNNNILLINADLTGSNSVLTVDPNFEEQEVPTDSYVQVDITIHADKKVEFVLPSATYPILRATASAGDTIRIESDTMSGKFSLVGDIGIRSGEIFYFQRSFYIKEGSLVFNENEISFDPRVTAIAETRDQSDNGPVTLSIIVNNQSLITPFAPIIESDPPLSQVEILSILGNALAGTATTDDTNQTFRTMLLSTSDVLGQFQIVRRVETKMRDVLHVDMLSFRTQLLQNALLQATATTAEERDSNLWNYLDNTTIFAGKYVTPNMFAQTMISTSYDRNQIENQGLSFDIFVGLELKSPLMNISWEMSHNPLKNVNKTGFIPDNKISLSKTWRLP
jgi:hypothetical protein